MKDYFNKNKKFVMTLAVLAVAGFGLLGITSGASAAITAGNYTLKTSGGDYSSWAAFWDDLGNLTGDITLTVDASAFTETSAPAAVTENLNGHTLKVTAATFPSTTDGSTGPRFTWNVVGTFLDMEMEGPGAVIIEGIVTLWGTGSVTYVYYTSAIDTSFIYTLRRNIIKGGYAGFNSEDNTPTYNIYNNIFYDQTTTGIRINANLPGFISNNTIVDIALGGPWGYGIDIFYSGLLENNLIYKSKSENFEFVSIAATGNNNSSYDATADDFFAGANNRINKTTSPFTNYATDDFTLAAGSDPIGNGTSTPSAYFTTDFFGNTRSAPWDIGAVQRNGYTVSSVLFTLSVWVKPTTAIATKAIAVKNNEIRLVTDASGKPACQIHNGTAWQTAATSTAALALNSWQYVSCVYGRSNIKVYINGVLQATQAMSAVDIQNTTNALNLGYDVGGTYGYFQGYIDEFKYYKYARTATQIKSDYTGVATKRGATIRSVTVGEQQDASEGLVGYWKMDEASWATTSATVLDSSGNGNNGTPYNHAQSTSTAKFGRAGTFDGTDDYVSVSNTISDVKTVEFWLKDSNSSDGILELINNSTYISIASNIITATGFTLPTIYVDGTQTSVLPATGWHHIAIITQTAVSVTGLNIGEANTDYLSGFIDDVKIYNKARTAEQIRRDYESGPPPVAHWKMDENTGQYAYDTSGTNNGTLGSSSTPSADDPTWVSGKYGSALKFDGVDDYVSLATPSIINPHIGTAMVWFKPRAHTNANAHIFSARNNAAGNSRVYIQDVGGNVDISIGNQVSVDTGADWTNGQWGFATLVWNNGQYIVYFNGINVSSGSYTDFSNIANEFRFGNFCGGTAGYEADGLIDDVRIYNYARTPKQIMEDMNAGHPTVGSPVGSYSVYYPFDSNWSTVVYDKSINANNASVSGADWTSAGKFGGGMRFFSSTSDVLSLGSNKFLYDEISVSFWANNIGGAANTPWAHYFVTRESDNDGCGIYYDKNTSKKLCMYCYKPGSGISQLLYTDKTFDGDIGWHFITATFSGNEGMKLYIDGVLNVSNSSYTSSFDDLSSTATYIGTGRSMLVGGEYITGVVDEFKIYPFVLSPQDIKNEYNGSAVLRLGSMGTDTLGNYANSASSTYCLPGDTSLCRAPVAHWKMDEMAGQYAYDSSENGNNGLLGTTVGISNDDPAWKVSGCKSGSCLSFDGNSDKVKVSYNSSFAFGDQDYTVEAWINHSGSNASATYRGIVLQTDSFPKGYCLRLGNPTDNKLFFFYGDANSWEEYTGTTVLAAGTWYHVTAVYTASTNRVQLYVNGIAEGSRTAGDGGYQQADINAPIYIGEDWIGTSRFFNGKIDDVRIYNYARTRAQIAWDYNRGAPVAHWKMNDGQDTATTCDATASTVKDSGYSCIHGGTCNTGTLYLSGSPATSTAWSEAKYGCGLTFDGTNDYVGVANSVAMATGTLSFWAKPNTTTQKLLQLTASDYVELSSGVVTVTGFGTETVYVDGKQTTAFPDTNWHNIVVVSNASTTANSIYLGRVSTAYLAGQLDDVRIYNYALTPVQIKTIFNQGSAVRFGPAEGLP